MNSYTNSGICLACFLRPTVSSALLFGFEIFIPCNCANRMHYNFLLEKLKTPYFRFVEFILWENFVKNFLQAIPTIGEHIPCTGIYSIMGNNFLIKITIAVLAFVIAFAISWVKRNKIPPLIRLTIFNNSDITKLSVIFNKIWFCFLNIAVFLVIWLQILNIVSFYPAFELHKYIKYEGLICSVDGGIWMTLFCNIVFHSVFFGVSMITMQKKGFLRMSENLLLLKPENCHLKNELEALMIQHADLWTYIEIFNSSYDYLISLVYIIFISATCVCYYIILFVDLSHELIYSTVFIAVCCSAGCIICGFMVSSYTAAMQNSFQDIRRFAECDFGLKFKLKILNFMKRFGKISLCYTFAGYFYVSKKFPIKMASSLHSIFEGLLNLRSVENKRIDCKLTSVMNYTDSLQN